MNNGFSIFNLWQSMAILAIVDHRMSRSRAELPCRSYFSARTGALCLLAQPGGFVSRFPGEVRILAPEVPVRRCLPVNGPAQLQGFDDPFGRELEVVAHQLLQFIF